MTQVKSIFGDHVNSIQLMIDKASDRFRPMWYPKYFDMGSTRTNLTFETVIGRSRIEAAASIVNRSSPAPLRSRAGLEKLTGTIPAIKEAFVLDETQWRDYEMITRAGIGNDQTRLVEMMKLIWNDVKVAGESAHKKVDLMALEAISTGYITMTTTNNPDGLVKSDTYDLLLPSDSRKQAAVTWATAASATPLTDIDTVVEYGRTKGISFEKILMTNALWLKFKKTTEVINTMKDFYYGPKSASGSTALAVTTMDQVNNFLTTNGYPVIEIVDESIGIEKDGVITPVQPFNVNNCTFIPSGKLGIIENSYAIEQLRPVPQVTYATYNKALISKWSQNNPFTEYTGVEFNACPSVGAIDSMVILTAVF